MISLCPSCGARIPKPRRKRIAQALPGVSRKDAKARKVDRRRFARTSVREAIVTRAGGHCEGCRAFTGSAVLHMDHFWGRAREESVESCWMLCPRCDADKTENRPTRRAWLGGFSLHCERHGYVEQLAKVDRAIALENAQHPRPSPPRDGRQDTKGAAPVDAATKALEGETT